MKALFGGTIALGLALAGCGRVAEDHAAGGDTAPGESGVDTGTGTIDSGDAGPDTRPLGPDSASCPKHEPGGPCEEGILCDYSWQCEGAIPYHARYWCPPTRRFEEWDRGEGCLDGGIRLK